MTQAQSQFLKETQTQFQVQSFGHGRHWLIVTTKRGQVIYPSDRKRVSKSEWLRSVPTEPVPDYPEYMATQEALGIRSIRACETYMKSATNWRKANTLFSKSEIETLKHIR